MKFLEQYRRQIRTRTSALTILMLALGALSSLSETAQAAEDYEQPPVRYSATEPHDAVSVLKTRLASGDIKWSGNERQIVSNLLRELGIPRESQVLVFSKTSFQRERIRPEHPRALYFSDTAYLGWLPGGIVEITTIDPKLGPVFYSVDPADEAVTFNRDNTCMNCHGGTFVRDIPGIFVRSLFTDKRGEPLLHHGSEVVTFRTPFTNRWGGWYVTGKHGNALHRGNVLAREEKDQLIIDLKSGANITNLSTFFDTKPYLAESSDIVALLVLEHQTTMQNSLTKASMSCRKMLTYQENLQRELKEPVTEELSYESVKSVFNGAAQDVVDDLLFKDEARLPEGIEGSEAFQKAFRANEIISRGGGSLKEFSLKGHIFKNRCSYLIYSQSFLSLPKLLKQLVYAQLRSALASSNPDSRYAYLSGDERAQILNILQNTHPEFRESVISSPRSNGN